MADPLSIAASIAGILTLAVQVSNGLAQIISDAKAADSLLTELTTDLLILCEILAKLQALSTWRESGSDHLLPTTLKRCDCLLKELQGIIVAVQESIATGGIQKRSVQITWSNKQKQIATISGKISEHKSTLMLTLQMQNALDMGDVKGAIHTFLESKTVARERNDRQMETMEGYMKSSGSSFYSADRTPSYPSTSLFASSGSSIRSGFSFRSSTSFRTCRDTPETASSDDETLSESGNSEPGAFSDTSSSTLALLPPTNMESIQIPPSLLGPDLMGAEQMWADLAPNLPTALPAPYSTFKERYLSVYPYLWLHGRFWHGNRATYGTFLVTRYSTQSGKIEFSRVELHAPENEPSEIKQAKAGNNTPNLNLAPEYLEAEPTILVGAALYGLTIVDDVAHTNHRKPRSAYSFHRVLPMSVNSSNTAGIWPPMTFPAEDRTTVSLSWRARPGDGPSYSQNLFGLRKRATGLDLLTGSYVELFAALDPNLYTPDIEHPLRGIWYRRTTEGYEFIYFHQRNLNHLEGLKLTGNSYVARGAKTFEFGKLRDGVEDGELHSTTVSGGWLSIAGLENRVSRIEKCAIDWLSTDHLTIRRAEFSLADAYVYYFRRLNVDQFF